MSCFQEVYYYFKKLPPEVSLQKKLGPAILLKKRSWHSCSPVTFVKFLKPFWQNTLHITTSVLLYFYYNQKDQKEKPRSFISFDFFVKIGPSQKFGMVLNMDL